MYDLVQAGRPYFEDVLVRQYERLRKAGVGTITYLNTHLALLELVLPEKPLKEVVAANGDWKACGAAVASLLEAGSLGKTIFVFAAQHAMAGDFAKEIAQHIEKLKMEGITEESIDRCKVACARTTSSFKASYHKVLHLVAAVCLYVCSVSVVCRDSHVCVLC
jgi:hypothetical protein